MNEILQRLEVLADRRLSQSWDDRVVGDPRRRRPEHGALRGCVGGSLLVRGEGSAWKVVRSDGERVYFCAEQMVVRCR